MSDSILLIKGLRIPLSEIVAKTGQADQFLIDLKILGINEALDFACFGLDAQQKLSDDRYMCFFNQPQTPCASVELATLTKNSAAFLCQLPKLPPTIERLVFTVTLDGNSAMRQIQSGYLRLVIADQEIARFDFAGNDFQDEKAIMLGEIYRKDSGWRFCTIAQGFNGGLAALVTHFGATVAEETSAPESKKVSLTKKIAEAAPKLVDLAKKATVSLEKRHLSSTQARIGLVLDASGSMSQQYHSGKVQAVIERLLPLAVHFDDDGELDVWAFSSSVLALPAATLNNFADYVTTAKNGWQKWGMMSFNNEPPVIEKVLSHYKNSPLPVIIIFISDGGISQNAAIKKLLIAAASLPIFWQFVGIGGRNYGVLEKLDTMAGRVVDNCGFFALDDVDSVSEQELYDLLLGEFPLWLAAAKSKGIVN